MTYSYNATNDYLWWDNTEAVTVTLRTAGVADDPVSVAVALREDVSRRLADSLGVQLRGDDLAWNIPAALMSGKEIHPGDFITDAGSVVYTVNPGGVQKIGVGGSVSHFLCLTTRQR